MRLLRDPNAAAAMCTRSGEPHCMEAKSFVSAAVKIQKVVRGFLVKKNVRAVRKAAADAERIALLVTRKADSIRHDTRERLQVGEMLMALLLRVDSARGVREYRRKVVRRVVLLQEAVDSIIASAAMSPESPIPREESKEVIGIELIPGSDISGRDQVKELKEATRNRQPTNVTEAGEHQVEEIKEVMEKGRMVEPSGAIQAHGMIEMMERTEGLMKELREQGAQQCSLMGELVQRVKQLEKKVQRMDRRKQLVRRIEQLEQKVQQLRRRKRKASDTLACSKKIARKT